MPIRKKSMEEREAEAQEYIDRKMREMETPREEIEECDHLFHIAKIGKINKKNGTVEMVVVCTKCLDVYVVTQRVIWENLIIPQPIQYRR